jgi:UDP-N-acetyl-D-mannosaminuronic acid dehydrogenase
LKISIIGGGGRVGLPLAILLANIGHKVVVIDIDEKRNNLINQRILPFKEKDADNLLKSLSTDKLYATTSNTEIENSETCILIIGTPVLEDGTPSANSLIELVKNLIPNLGNTKLLMLRSTVYPGIAKKIQEVLNLSGLKINVAFCPERIAEGNALAEIKVLPQIIGVETDTAFELSKSVFDGISTEIIRTTFEEAELTKLFANAFRYLNFAIANEFFQICSNNNINWENVWYALRHNYPRASSLPLPGFAAGPCLVKDTQQLDYYSSNFLLGRSALIINEKFPEFILNKLTENFDLQNMTVGILGMTFKANVDDFRSSLSFSLKHLLENKAKEVYCSDTELQEPYFIDTLTLIEISDIVIVATPHTAYKNLMITKPTVDIWRITSSKSLV